MGSISVQGVSKQFGSQVVLDNVSIDLHAGRTVGMVGPNGAGKTTLFKIIAGIMSPDLGTVTRSKGVQIGYLAQEPEVDSANTVHDEVSSVFAGLFALERRLHDLSEQMATTTDSDILQELMTQYDRVSAQFDAAGGYTHEQRIAEILGGLGFSNDDWSLPVSVLSGGQRCRLALAKLLLQDRQMLLLDEPTNHLDIDAVRWLEKFLAGHHGGAVIISHDRYLLDRLADSIIEVDNRHLTTYPGNYTNYSKTKSLRHLTQQRQFEKDAEFIEKERAFIAKHLAGQRTKEAQGRRARLERRIKDGEFVLEKPESRRQVRFTFTGNVLESGTVCRVDELAKSYDDKKLFSDLSLQVDAGKRLGITGPNGTGKTTLLRILLSSVPADKGEFTFHSQSNIGYYAQDAEGLDCSKLVIDEIRAADGALTEQEARSLLAGFNFRGDDVFKGVSSLSGGEQSRIRLMKLLMSDPNVLILDEPTNHLDVASREALEEALTDFPGTIITVSHDRYFLDKIVDQLIVIRPEGHERCLGNYSDYIRLQDDRKAQIAAKNNVTQKGKVENTRKSTGKKGNSPASRFDAHKIEELEELIVKLEDRLADMTARFADPGLAKNPEALARQQNEFDICKAELSEAEQVWNERIESM